MKRLCYALDLRDEPHLIAAYEAAHQNVWPEILTSLKEAGIHHAEIYRTGNRLFMILETSDDYSPERKAALDNNNPRVSEWEQLMWTYQQALPGSKPGEKWMPMNRIFSL
jgi:L-rhamnose mutarotase